jgi:hypothetical protein
MILPNWPWVRWLTAVALLLPDGLAQAGITSYGAFKGRNYFQASAAPPTASLEESHFAFFFAQGAAQDDIVLATATPHGSTVPMFMVASELDPERVEAESFYNTEAALNAAVPNEPVTFSIFDSTFQDYTASLTLAGDGYPAPTGLSNFAAAQQIDARAAFSLHWTSPVGLTADDFIVLQLENSEGPLWASQFPGLPGALAGTATSFSIPASLLIGQDLSLNLTFVNVTQQDTTSISGATGLSGYVSSIDIPLKLASGGTGGDTTPPRLLSSTPASPATGVPTSTSLTLHFSEAMQAGQQVNWFNVPNTDAITYSWSQDGETLTCSLPGGFPANASIIWALDPDSFKDLAGNSLTGAALGGVFATAGSGGSNPCEGGLNERTNLFFVSKEISYQQTSASAPVEHGDPVASFGTFFTPAAGTPVTAASVQLPGGEVKNLTSLFGNYFLSAEATSEAALIAAYPVGSYTGTLTAGSNTGSVTLPAVAAPPVPQVANYAAAQAVDPTAAFTLQWGAFTGAAGNDRLQLTVADDTGKTVFQAPDECAQPPVVLASSATAVTLPANLLAAGKTYQAELRFMKLGDFVTQSVPAFQGAASSSKLTRLTLKTTGGVLDTVLITAYRLPADGRFEVEVKAAASQTVFLEAWVNFNAWEPVNGGVAGANGQLTLKDQRLQVPDAQAYRVRTQ